MPRYRSRSRSYSPRRRSRTPPRLRKRYDDDVDEPRDRFRDSRSHRDRRSPAPSGLLVRNLPMDARQGVIFSHEQTFSSAASSRSVSPPRNDIRDRGMKDDYRSSSRRSRSVSRSYSPVDERDHKSNQRSPSPAGNGGGGTPHGVEENPSRRSPSSRINDRSPSRSRSRSYE
ncbi:hypothetical protein LINPERPRIM_LOCUS18517 [Linum perenne]